MQEVEFRCKIGTFSGIANFLTKNLPFFCRKFSTMLYIYGRLGRKDASGVKYY